MADLKLTEGFIETKALGEYCGECARPFHLELGPCTYR